MAVNQSGVATLSLALLLLALVMMVSLHSARFKMQEQRIMANHIASQQAAIIAEAALEQVIMQVAADPSALDGSRTGTVAGASYRATLVSQRFTNSHYGVVDIVAVRLTAHSADGRARSTLQQQLLVIPNADAELFTSNPLSNHSVQRVYRMNGSWHDF